MKPVIAYSRSSDFDPEPSTRNLLLKMIQADHRLVHDNQENDYDPIENINIL